MSKENNQLFDKAVDCLIHGDYNGLKDVINEHPNIVHQRAAAPHRAQLIHYLGANGVENHLQKSPANAAQIAELLLSNGADPNSTAKIYNTDSNVLDLLVSSVHPYLARVQSSLVQVFIEGGAKVNGANDDGSPLGTALGFGYTAAGEMLYQMGAAVNNISYAAGLGLIELIKSRTSDPGFLSYKCNPSDQVGAFTWPPPCLPDSRINAMIYAAFHNRIEVVAYFINQGLDPNAGTKMMQTPLHFAAYAGHSKIVELLVESGAKPDTLESQWNSIPAGWAKKNGHYNIMNYLIKHT